MTMTPVEQIRELYLDHNASWTEDLGLFFRHGWVVSTPYYFCFFRPVDRLAPLDQLRNPAHEFVFADCLFIHAFAGDMRSALAHLPFRYEWIGWERRGKARIFTLADIEEKLQSCDDAPNPSDFLARSPRARFLGRGQPKETETPTAGGSDTVPQGGSDDRTPSQRRPAPRSSRNDPDRHRGRPGG